MFEYMIRRMLYMIPILVGVNIITFGLFFMVNSPDNMARFNLGQKHVTLEAISQWKVQHGYQYPLFYNSDEKGVEKFSKTIFFQKSLRLFLFDFGPSDAGRQIGHDISQRMWPSLAIAIPTLIIGLLVNINFSMIIIFFRNTYLERLSLVVCITMMSISALFYIIAGQFVFAKILKIFPISGYVPGPELYKFLIMPIMAGVISGIGSGTRWYRILFLEEIHKDYVKTARAKGLSERAVLFKHVLRNALIPILTGVVVLIPLLFMGSLIIESFFGIPGLGSYTIDAISQQDFAIVRAMVFLGSVLYIIGLILTDFSYTLVDPRVRLERKS